jgi:hypothetical protein
VQTYAAPLADFRFLLEGVLDYRSEVAALPGFEEATLDTVVAVLEEAAAFSESVLLPRKRRNIGPGRGEDARQEGGITCASPSSTSVSPTQARVARVTRRRCESHAVTSTWHRTWSPGRTGARNTRV